MMIDYLVYFKRYGARLPQYLLSPRIINLNLFSFNRDAIWHYTLDDGVSRGPNITDYYLREIDKKIFVQHVIELGARQGSPKRTGISIKGAINDYHMRNPRFRKTIDIVKEPVNSLQLGVVSYSLLGVQYRYIRSIYSTFYRWHNKEKTVWSEVKRIAARSQRNQFLIYNLPQVLPSLQRLEIFSEKFDHNTLKRFPTPESLFLLEFWKWLGMKTRSNSLFGELTEDELYRVNIVFVEGNGFMLINLGVLNSWIDKEASLKKLELEEDSELTLADVTVEEPLDASTLSGIKPSAKFHEFKLKKMFLRGMMALIQTRVADLDVVPEKVNRPVTADEIENNIEATSGNEYIVTHDDFDQQLEDESRKIDELNDIILNMDEDLKQLEIVEKSMDREIDAPSVITADDQNDAEVVLPDVDAIDDMDLPEPPMIDTMDDVAPEKRPETKEKEKPKRKEQTDTPLPKLRDMLTPDEEVSFTVFEEKYTPQTMVKKVALDLAEIGAMKPSDLRKLEKLIEDQEKIPSPVPGIKLVDFAKITPEDIKMPDVPEIKDSITIPDKSMLKSSLMDFDKKYIEEVMAKDCASIVLGIQKAGLVVTDYEKELVESISGDFEIHTTRVTPVKGKSSTMRYLLPKVDEDGTFTVNGNRYRLRKQRFDKPIRKINETRVALSTYYGKSFVDRSTKKAYNYQQWLSNIITSLVYSPDSSFINVHPNNVFDNTFKCPRMYSMMAMSFKSFIFNGYEFNFDHKLRDKLYDADIRKKYEVRGSIIVAKNRIGSYLLLDKNNTLYQLLDGKLTPLQTLEEFLGLEIERAPVEYAEVKVYGKSIPVGLVLAYKYGWTKLIEKLGVKYRIVGAGHRLNLQVHEYAIRFSDENWIFSRDDRIASLVLGGFLPFTRTTTQYSIGTFDRVGVYLNVLQQANIGVKYLREIDLMDRMFVDPISEEILKEMGEPTTFRGLLIRACEMLLTDTYPHPIDFEYARIRGYERFAGFMYNESVKAVRDHASNPNSANMPITVNPYSVWKRVMQDPSKEAVNDINPIQNLKEIEALTFSGDGGRDSRSMVRSSREYHPNDVGIVSEATVDSHQVSVNTFTSANPNIKTLRGTVGSSDAKTIDATSLLSTTALLSPASDRDDPKRVNFASIQQSHTVACESYEINPVRTGYEEVIVSRVTKDYAGVAKEDGIVTRISDEGMTVQYKSGKEEGFLLGKRFSAGGQGLTLPHVMITNGEIKQGTKFKKGDVLTYNKDFFAKSPLNKNSIVWKNNIIARVALLENRQTFEDSCAITTELADKLATQKTEVRHVEVEFEQEVSNIAKVGDTLINDTVLCSISDKGAAKLGSLDDISLNILRALSSQTPIAKCTGTLEKIEVFYNGEKEDMSESLRALADVSDRMLAKSFRAQGKRVHTGQDENFRFGKDRLMPNTAAIVFYITERVIASTGDKGVFGNQLKTVISEVIADKITTESGRKLDGYFGSKSIFNRVVNSPFVIGTTIPILKEIGKRAAKIYKGK